MATSSPRNENLIRENLDLLNQAVVLLDRLPEDTYTKETAGQRVGAQMRHVLEFYECFLDGLPGLHVDYSARRRDPVIQNDREAAAARARELVDRIAASEEVRGDGAVWVRAEDADACEADERFVMSSVARELQSLISHTTHHYAIVALVLRAQAIDVDPEFGVSQSTLRHWRSLEKVAA